MNLWHKIEIAIIVGVIIYQLLHTYKVHLNISKLKNIFSFKLFLRTGFVEKEKIGAVDFDSTDVQYEESFSEIADDDIVKLSLIDTEGRNEVISQIKKAINTYLINNYGAAVNFSIIKDIVDREIAVKDDEISQSVTLPLYLGLAATMIGIIFGLFSMPELNGDGFSLGVNDLIGGVKIAMLGSLSGLACTTYLSSFSYKKARRIVQKDKNEQLTYMQAKLLPELIKAEDTGVSGLKASLDRFARVATNISDNVLTAANQTGENLELQKDVIEKVDNMEVLKVSKWNLELFEKLENNMESLNKFSAYIANMERITSQLLEFANRTSDVNKVINGIDDTLVESRQLTRFLSAHFDKIENSGNAALKSVGIVESHFEESINALKNRTEEMISNLYKSAGSHEEKLESIYKHIEGNLNNITSQYIESFKDAYSDSIPKFNQLDNLELMKDINSSIKNMQQNQSLLDKLSSIEAGLRNRQSRNSKVPTNGSFSKHVISKGSDGSVSLVKVIKKIF
ncbi:hypothetical protein ACT3CD_14805 [Geofilum sp. OHC36d9]|uniref:hypothetical protein n=1 Tax=Geofilum sp. OHC36d9 TaxID=3458413 RepID=UPI00403437D2